MAAAGHLTCGQLLATMFIVNHVVEGVSCAVFCSRPRTARAPTHHSIANHRIDKVVRPSLRNRERSHSHTACMRGGCVLQRGHDSTAPLSQVRAQVEQCLRCAGDGRGGHADGIDQVDQSLAASQRLGRCSGTVLFVVPAISIVDLRRPAAAHGRRTEPRLALRRRGSLWAACRHVCACATAAVPNFGQLGCGLVVLEPLLRRVRYTHTHICIYV